MRHRFRCVVLLATAFSFGTAAYAGLPLTIEDLDYRPGPHETQLISQLHQ